MGLHGDIEETKQAWKKVSWPMKVIYSLMLFLSISSIASLAQTVADWKGFFLTGIEFYQNVLRDPVLAWFEEHANAKFPEYAGDMLTLLFMASVPMISALRSSLLRANLLIPSLPRSTAVIVGRFRFIAHLVIWLMIAGLIVMFILAGWGNMIYGIEETLPSYMYPLIGSAYALVVFSALAFPGATPIEKTLAVAPPLVVLLLAAINKGLSM